MRFSTVLSSKSRDGNAMPTDRVMRRKFGAEDGDTDTSAYR